MNTQPRMSSSERGNPFRAPQAGAPSQRAVEVPCDERETQIREILVPIDFSDHSAAALRQAMLFARKFGAAITLLNVIEPPAIYPEVIYPNTITPEEIMAAAEAALARLCGQANLKRPLMRQTVIETGTPCERILETARARNIDLIVIATHGRTGLAHVLLGSTAEKVIRHARCPVLVVRLDQSAASAKSTGN